MTEKELDVRLMEDNLRDLFKGYYFRASFTERAIIEKIHRDVYRTIEESYREKY